MFDVKITKKREGNFTHYIMSPGVLLHSRDNQHIATSVEFNDMFFVAFSTVYHDLPAMPGAWFLSAEEAELAVERWGQIVHVMSHYKTLITYVKDLEPPF